MKKKMQKRAKYDPGPVVSRYAGVLCEEIAGQWCMREAEQQAAANLAPGLQAEVLRRCPTHGLLQHYGELFDVSEDELTRRYEPLVTRRRWKALTQEHGRPKILPRHFTTQYFGWQCMAIASSSGDDRGIYFATVDEIWKMDNEYAENSWRKIADIPRDVYYDPDKWKRGLAGMYVSCRADEHALYLVTTINESILRLDLSGDNSKVELVHSWWKTHGIVNGNRAQTIASKMSRHETTMIFSHLRGSDEIEEDGVLVPTSVTMEVHSMPISHGRDAYRFKMPCVRYHWFHSQTWIATIQDETGSFRIVHIPYLLSRRFASSLYDGNGVSFSVEKLSDYMGRSPTSHPLEDTNQFLITDDGKLIAIDTSVPGIMIFQLDPVARSGQYIRTVGPISLDNVWSGMAYSADPEQRLIILSNGMSDSLALFDTVTLEHVGNLHCDTKMERTLASILWTYDDVSEMGFNFEVNAYVHRKRFLHAKGGLPTRNPNAEKWGTRGEVTLNVLRVSYGNRAHVLFDRNRLILYGRNHYYMYTLTLGPPDHKWK